VDDRERGGGSEELEVEPGEHQIRMEAEGHRPWRGLAQLRPNETRLLDVALQRVWPDPESGDLVHPIAVIVDNLDRARPQAGLDQADVVYEALAEGGITRFLAVYATHDPEVVGPVRSARHYFVHWAREFGAPLAHIGASPQGFGALRAGGVTSIEDGRGLGVFWRSRDRRAPHNAYTSIAATRAKLRQATVQPGSFGGLSFREGGLRLAGSPAPIAAVKYGPWRYTVTWRHDPRANDYVRHIDGAPHVDAASGQQIRASNVLVQWVPTRPIPGDGAGRLDLADVGTGPLLAFLDGVAIEGTWSKASLGAPTAYRDREGRPLELNAGPTWIHIVPLNGRVDVRRQRGALPQQRNVWDAVTDHRDRETGCVERGERLHRVWPSLDWATETVVPHTVHFPRSRPASTSRPPHAGHGWRSGRFHEVHWHSG